MMEQVRRTSLECPVCLQLPERKVFQCKFGHPICQQCCLKVELCPQCREPYGTERIRNLALEELVGGLQISCKHKEAGCQEMVSRADYQTHLNSCKFRPLAICKVLGFPDCNFTSSEPCKVFQHLASIHELPLTNERVFRADLEDNLNSMKSEEEEGNIFTGLVEVDNCKFLTHFELNKTDGEYYFNCFQFCEEEEPCLFKLKIQFFAPEKDICWTWGVNPTSYKNVETAIRNPAFKIPVAHFLECMDEPGSTVEFAFRQIQRFESTKAN